MKISALAVLLLVFFTAPALRADVSDSLAALKSIGPEGKGNTEAAAAWKDLTAEGPSVLVPALEAMDGASPLSRNWLRTAAETVFHDAVSAETEIPSADLREFLLDREKDPAARRLAFELYREFDSDDAESLVPAMIDDPATPLRREAVAQLIDTAKKQLAEEKKSEAIETARTALDAAREVDQIEAIAGLLRKDLGESVDLPKQFGFLMHWHLVAPFDNTERAGFEEVFPPEEGSVDLTATYTGKEEKEILWQEYATSDDYGKVDFNQPFGPLKQVVGYAYTEFDSAEETAAQLRLGCKNAWKIWLNGELIFGRDEYHRGQRIDQYILPVSMKKGKNTLLVKACQNEQEQDWTVQWEFQLRVTDPAGTALLSTDRKPTPKAEAPSRRPGANQ